MTTENNNTNIKNVLDLPVGDTEELSLEEQIIALKEEIEQLQGSKKKAQARHEREQSL